MGIGTSSPAALLELKHNSASTHLRLTENTSGNWSALGVDTSDNLRIYTNNTERMRISSTGVISGDGSGLTGVGGTTLLATITTSGAREVSISNLDLSNYSLLYFYGNGVAGDNFWDKAHIRDSSQTTNGFNLIGNVQRSDYTNEIGYFGGVISLDTGYGWASSSVIRTSTSNKADNVPFMAGGLVTGITTSTTTVVIGHTGGGSNNWIGGTVKIYGA